MKNTILLLKTPNLTGNNSIESLVPLCAWCKKKKNSFWKNYLRKQRFFSQILKLNLQTGNSVKEWKIDHMWYQRQAKYFCTSPKNVVSIFGQRSKDWKETAKTLPKKVCKSDLEQNICYIYLPDVHVLDFSTCYYELSFKLLWIFSKPFCYLDFRLDNYILFIA